MRQSKQRRDCLKRISKYAKNRLFLHALSPYTYLARGALENIAEKVRASIQYRPVDVVSLFGRTGGVALPDRHPSRLDYRAQDLTRRAAMLNMPFHLKPAHVPTNPAPASYAIIAAQNAGNGDLGGLVQGILRAAWAEEKDIANDAVLRDLLAVSYTHLTLPTKRIV